ncbi:hypothetical protein [Rhizobium sp. SGZ-381]|uniref:hypothetical protein n=1 Tax=Rhizobium sp. SGZ-381 TaxID=3342800 RepID=UPI00366FB5B8
MQKPVHYLLLVLFGLAGLFTGTWASSRFLDAGSAEKYIVDQDNRVVPVPLDQFGLSKEQAAFVSRMRMPVFSDSGPFDLKHKKDIRQALLAGYQKDGPLLDQWATFSSDRERFIAYLMIRVNGSFPNFEVRPLSGSLTELLTSQEGNCGDLTVRLLMLLDLFSIQARAIAWNTPAIEGHMFVDAYDPEEGKAYFLDPTNNLMAAAKTQDEGTGFIDILSDSDVPARLDLLDEQMKQFPLYFASATGVSSDFENWASSNALRVYDVTINGLAYELPQMLERWSAGGDWHPSSLCRLAGEGNPGLAVFQPQNCLPIVSLTGHDRASSANNVEVRLPL